MKISLKTCKPRNPFVAAARLRQSGSHRPGKRVMRQQAEQALRRELDRMKPSP